MLVIIDSSGLKSLVDEYLEWGGSSYLAAQSFGIGRGRIRSLYKGKDVAKKIMQGTYGMEVFSKVIEMFEKKYSPEMIASCTGLTISTVHFMIDEWYRSEKNPF